jgi:hypothetical protein
MLCAEELPRGLVANNESFATALATSVLREEIAGLSG